MKAEVIRWNNSLVRYTVKIIKGISYGRMSKEKAKEIADQFNSALDQHVQSSLQSKIEAIKAEFTDEWIKEWAYYEKWGEFMPTTLRTHIQKKNECREEGAKAMRDEILNRLEK